MVLNAEIEFEIKKQGADFVHFVDMSALPKEKTKNFKNAILIGLVLSPEYLRKITNTSDYVKKMIRNKEVNQDEFHLKELEADRLADHFANYLLLKGFSAYSQSENNISITGYYNKKTKTTPLPAKSIALIAGIGWIGKHNLLVTPEFGSAICMSTVLTDAPLQTVAHTPAPSECGTCSVCTNICPVNAIKGKTWGINVSRDEMVDVYKCNSCIECLVFCPYTQDYIKKELE